MYKFAKLSLVTSLALASFATSSVASDSLADAFKDGKVKGAVKAMYFERERMVGTQEGSILAVGGNLGYVTGDYMGLRFGATFQHSSVADTGKMGSTEYSSDMYAHGSVLSEAYLGYKIGNTDIKIGRQYIATPLLLGSGSRMIKESFEAYLLSNTDISNTKIVAGYVTKHQKRTEGSGVVGKFDQDLVNEGAALIYVTNTSVENLKLQAQYVNIAKVDGSTSDDQKLFYADAAYKIAPVTISLQTYQTDNGAATASDGKFYGIKVAGKVAGVSLSAGFTTTDDEATVLRGIGEGAYKTFAGGPISSGGSAYLADTDSFQVTAGYKFDFGLSTLISYSEWDVKAEAKERSEAGIVLGYAFNKNLSTKVMYSDYDGAYVWDKRTRVYLTYAF